MRASELATTTLDTLFNRAKYNVKLATLLTGENTLFMKGPGRVDASGRVIGSAMTLDNDARVLGKFGPGFNKIKFMVLPNEMVNPAMNVTSAQFFGPVRPVAPVGEPVDAGSNKKQRMGL